jgi:hypothetical protein
VAGELNRKIGLCASGVERSASARPVTSPSAQPSFAEVCGAQYEQKSAPITVPDVAQVEHGGRQAERVADRDQVKRRLRRLERRADVGGSATLATVRLIFAIPVGRISVMTTTARADAEHCPLACMPDPRKG